MLYVADVVPFYRASPGCFGSSIRILIGRHHSIIEMSRLTLHRIFSERFFGVGQGPGKGRGKKQLRQCGIMQKIIAGFVA